MSGSYFGKYRGKVVDTDDPDRRGRIKVQIAALFGEHLTDWALPCFPLASNQAGLFGVPPAESWVWIEFEQGDPQFPIWTGCFWDKRSTLPEAAHLLPGRSLAVITPDGHAIELRDDREKGIHLQVPKGPSVHMQQDSLVLKAAKGAQIQLNDDKVLIQTEQGATLQLDKRGIVLKLSSGAQIELGDSGISMKGPGGAHLELGQSSATLESGSGAKIRLTGVQISMNDGALEVT